MTKEPNKAFKDRLKAICPLVDNIRLMLGAARHGFNRHSLVELEKIAELRENFTLDIDPFFEEVEARLKKSSETDKPALLKFQGILAQLELMADQIAGLADPIRRKGNHGTIFKDKDYFQINDLFAQVMGLLRALVDIFQQDDASLKAYVLQEGRKLRDDCLQSKVDHGTLMMDSPGQPDPVSIYLALLEHFRETLGHLMEIVGGLD